MSEDDLALSVILCVFNGAARMGGQLDALLAQQWDEPWEIVIVDNGSTDATAAVAAAYAAREPRITVVDASDRKGLSHARNVGVARSRGRAVAFCDDDDRVAAGWVAAMGRALTEHRVVASRMEYDVLSEATANTGRAAFQSAGIENVFGYPIVVGAAGWRRDVWDALGGNDEDLDFSGEDHDMALRAHLELGIDPYFASDALYHYRRRSGAGPTFHQARRYGRAQVVLYDRYGRGRPGAPEPMRRVVRQWLWLGRHVVDVRRPAVATHWAWRAGLRVGRAQESVRRRVWYP